MSISITTLSYEAAMLALVYEAQRKPGQIVLAELDGGCYVTAHIGPAWTTLTLSRIGAEPSEDQFRRVLEAWPYSITVLTAPAKRVDNGNVYSVEAQFPAAILARA